jgi:hypothetical protein
LDAINRVEVESTRAIAPVKSLVLVFMGHVLQENGVDWGQKPEHVLDDLKR